ncbi:acyl-CoA reductase [Novosphingobium sp. TH158]|uniref:acyl-CoA reductase n=1 Tax=Novosphingobium sp. TH158 TaxID=2067455 RepID=UPI000C7CAF25|nr:acyl-CoA reductase [Novosphingobium sp. TH158]PLK26155.1 long-chain-fatty-acyl-CoA reductase [Novosphingobium sp. TH158]
MTEIIQKLDANAEPIVSAPFFLRGELVEGNDIVQKSRDLGVTFATPNIPYDKAIPKRTEVPPLLNVPVSEIIDFLVETGQRLVAPDNEYVHECFDRMASTHILPRSVFETVGKHAVAYLDKRILEAEVEQSFRDPGALDGWVPKEDFTGRKSFVRAYAPRLIHVLPGNSPGVAVKSIAQGALVKAVNLFKMSSADPFYTVAILRTMAQIDPEHPIVKSMSAVYWRGGDAAVENVLYRPQYFDKIVAWGGGDAINNVIKYLGPGFQLVSFDPKTSISMVGREALASEEIMEETASRCAADLMMLNQEACAASRYQFVEGPQDLVDKWCAKFQRNIAERAAASGDVRPLSGDLRDEVEALMMMDDEYGTWGKADGKGLVIRSEEPVDFHPINKIGNVVRVDSLDDAVKYVNVATQTIGFYPSERMADYRDRLGAGGAQRVCPLGEAGPSTVGNPWDGMYPLHRFVNWMVNEDGMGE